MRKPTLAFAYLCYKLYPDHPLAPSNLAPHVQKRAREVRRLAGKRRGYPSHRSHCRVINPVRGWLCASNIQRWTSSLLKQCFGDISGQILKVVEHPQRGRTWTHNREEEYCGLWYWRSSQMLWGCHKCRRFARAALVFAIRETISSSKSKCSQTLEILGSVDYFQRLILKSEHKCRLLQALN